jgi:DNA-directed RNA polymerase subunit RPC12/RpoP
MTTTTKDEAIIYLILGDGDFSFSLDLGTFLRDNSSTSGGSSQLIATGFDSLDDLQSKYRNTPFVLKQLERLEHVRIHHCINAVNHPTMHRSETTIQIPPANIVIFNHPHLGTESAVLHAQFLCHLFFTVSHSWMRTNGKFHLTLAKGQYERWECQAAAERHGMRLVHRGAFQVPNNGEYYELRRHQTGKSFKSRTTSSETFTFACVRTQDQQPPSDDACTTTRPSWWKSAPVQETVYSCPHCHKDFREDRALKSHLRSKHASDNNDNNNNNENNNKRKRSFECEHCQKEQGAPPRTFDSIEALNEHCRAKHTGVHQDLQPDWCRVEKQVVVTAFGSCSICSRTFESEQAKEVHQQSFLPVANQEKVSFACSFCHKTFGEQRAQRQHENGCVVPVEDNQKECRSY